LWIQGHLKVKVEGVVQCSKIGQYYVIKPKRIEGEVVRAFK